MSLEFNELILVTMVNQSIASDTQPSHLIVGGVALIQQPAYLDEK